MPGKQFTDLTKASALKDSDIFAVHDGNGLKKSSMGDVTAYMSDKFSNPNLLINPDFKINQREQNIYNTEPKSIYTVDRWSIYMPVGGSVKPNSDGTITVTNNSNDQGWFFQTLESKIENVVFTANVISVSGIVNIYADDAGKTITNTGITSLQSESAKKCGFVLTANSSITLKWVKLEQGSIATPFVAPNPTEELMKCRRFFYKSSKTLIAYGISNNIYIKSTEVTNMRGGGTVVIVNDSADNYIRYEGNSEKVSIDVKNFAISTTDGYIRIIIENNNLINSKVVALDLNSVITIDAEIY